MSQTRAELSARLLARRSEIEQAILARVYAISDPGDTGDSGYAEGLRAAVSAAIDYGLATIELGEEGAPPVPPALLIQARLAARSGIGLDVVLRRYFAGYTLLGDFLLEEAERSGVHGKSLKRLLRAQAALFDRLLAAVSKEHGSKPVIAPSPPSSVGPSACDGCLPESCWIPGTSPTSSTAGTSG